jgi:hypothetical protein
MTKLQEGKTVGDTMIQSRITKESMHYPICSYNTTEINEEMRDDLLEGDIRMRLQHEFFRSVRAVCTIRKEVILQRRRCHCDYLAQIKFKNEEQEYLKSHFKQVDGFKGGGRVLRFSEYRPLSPLGKVLFCIANLQGTFLPQLIFTVLVISLQVYVDKSRDCGKPSGSPGTPISVQQLFRQPSRNRLERLETNMVRKRALVEAIPAVMVVHELRNLVLHDGGVGALVHKRGQEASIREGLENQARLKDPDFVNKRIEYVDKVMNLLPQDSQEILGRYPSCAVVGNAVRIRGVKKRLIPFLSLQLPVPNAHALSCS